MSTILIISLFVNLYYHERKIKKRGFLLFFLWNRQRPILPGRLQPSTFSAEGLNFCVRNVYRWYPFAIVTGMVECPSVHSQLHSIIIFVFLCGSKIVCSTLYDQALDLLVSVSSIHHCTYTSDLSPCSLQGVLLTCVMGYLILRRISRLDAFSVYSIQTSLPSCATGVTTGAQ